MTELDICTKEDWLNRVIQEAKSIIAEFLKETFVRYRKLGKLILDSGYRKGQWKSEHKQRFLNELGIEHPSFNRMVTLGELSEEGFVHAVNKFPSLHAWANQKSLAKATFEYPLYNVWKTFQIDNDYGQDYPGRTPHQIIESLLYYYTDQNALVADPMAGGGTTIDVCQKMNRKVRAFDINPARPDIEQNNVLEGIPHNPPYDFIFLDPPYYVQKDEYIRNEFNESIESFYKAMQKTLHNCHEVLKEKGILALMLKPMGLHENGHFEWEDLTLKCHALAEQIGFKLTKRICVPLNTQQYNALDVVRAKKGRYMLNTLRDVLVYQK